MWYMQLLSCSTSVKFSAFLLLFFVNIIAVFWQFTWPLNPWCVCRGLLLLHLAGTELWQGTRSKAFAESLLIILFSYLQMGFSYLYAPRYALMYQWSLESPLLLQTRPLNTYSFKNAKSCPFVKSDLWLFASCRSSFRVKPGIQLCRQHGSTLRLYHSWKRPTLLLPFPNFNKQDIVLVHSSLLSNLIVNPRCEVECNWMLCLSCLTQGNVLMCCLLISASREQFSKANWSEVCVPCAE